jgi:hypothetical protein
MYTPGATRSVVIWTAEKSCCAEEGEALANTERTSRLGMRFMGFSRV